MTRGVIFKEQMPVIGLVVDGTQLRGVKTPFEDLYADNVVVASGAWSRFVGEWIELTIPTYPIRGQVAILNKLDGPLRHIVMRSDTYVVPRLDGTILVGCTRERDVGFNQHVTVGGMANVLRRVQGLIPETTMATLGHTRSGLRPGIEGGVPAVGPLAGCEGLILATGHDRSGILLAPLTAHKISEIMVSGQGSESLGILDANRLSRTKS